MQGVYGQRLPVALRPWGRCFTPDTVGHWDPILCTRQMETLPRQGCRCSGPQCLSYGGPGCVTQKWCVGAVGTRSTHASAKRVLQEAPRATPAPDTRLAAMQGSGLCRPEPRGGPVWTQQ